MAFVRKRRLYESLPIWIQRSVQLVPFRWLAGRAYREVLARGPRFEHAGREEILAHRERALGDLLRFAVEQVPAYRDLRGTVDRLPPAEALQAFPLLAKEDLQERLQQHLPRDFERIPHYEITTGGTSGNQLRIFVDDASQAMEHAFVHRLWARVGYTPRSRKATFRGVPFPDLRPGVYWRHNPINSELQFSPFHMNDSTLPAYVEMLRRYEPTFFHGYPSAIEYLARYVLRNEIRLPPLRAALLVSEGCSSSQREVVEAAFHTRVFSFYGLSERTVQAGECELNTAYHVVPDYGHAEILREDGTACEEGESGEIVGTGFLNRSLPLIRYRSADWATRLAPDCDCGRSWDRFSDVEPHRRQELLVTRSGGRFSLAAINMHGPVFDKVERFQYVQERPGECELRAVVAPGFAESDLRAIEQAYAEKVAGELDVRVRIVEEIPLTERGKLCMLVSTLPESEGADAAP
jgi:phenylacetate-CoA ligase